MQDKMHIIDIVRNTIRQNSMVSKGDTVLVGLSGGADSVCLLHILKFLSKELGIKLAAAHIHHGIRGDDADRDAEFARDICKRLDIPFYLNRADVPTLSKEKNVSLETAGRLARYQIFREICRKNKISLTATAHNRNDQAETVLMRVFRGAGIDGLAGIRYVRPDGVIRPLLDVTREEIEIYCQENNLRFCIDKTNLENDYTRNRIRNQILPMLKEEYNPNILGALSNVARNMAEDGDFLDGYAERLYKSMGCPLPKRRPVVLDIESLKLVQPSIRTRLLSLAAKEAMGKSYHADRVHWEMVNSLLDKETGSGVMLPGELYVVVRYGWLAFEAETDRAKKVQNDEKVQFNIEIDKIYEIDKKTISFSLTDGDIKLNKNQMILDYDKVDIKNLTLRYRENGDKIALFKDGKKKKLKDYFIDKKIPKEERDKILLICNDDEVVAAVGYRVAETYKKDKDTKRGLVITYGTGN